MDKEQLILRAKRTIDSRRLNAMDTCDKVLESLRKHTDWRECEQQLKAAQVAYALRDDASAKLTIDQCKTLQQKLLKKYGLTPADLRPKFHCEKCQDTGYVNGKTCQCLQIELRKLLANESNVANVNYTFENSTEKDKHNVAVYKKAQEVCLGCDLKNILLTSNTGHGKTYLLSACANKCVQLGKSVLFVTAYNLNSLFLECHLSDLATKQLIMDNLTNVDVLAIDDLGTENILKNVTGEYLFAVINERVSQGLQTFISTNLTLDSLRDRYDERIFSRLIDRNCTLVATLQGADKRVVK